MAGTDIVQVKPHLFQKGHAKMGGRKKGARSPAAPPASSDWQRLVGWMREFSFNLSE
jgi:hypothetical protein